MRMDGTAQILHHDASSSSLVFIPSAYRHNDPDDFDDATQKRRIRPADAPPLTPFAYYLPLQPSTLMPLSPMEAWLPISSTYARDVPENTWHFISTIID